MEIRLDDSGSSEIKELKSKCRQYFSHYSLFITLGLIWIVGAVAGHISHHLSILLFIIFSSLTKPILSLITIILRTNRLNNKDTLKLSTKITALGIIFGLSVVFFPFVNNINHFFPAFGIVQALIFLAIYVASRLKIYLFSAAFFVTEALWLGYNYSENFIYPGYYIGASMFGIGACYLLAGRITKLKISLFKKRQRQKTNANGASSQKKSSNKSSISEKI